jgi:hypothetical protein
LFAPNEISQNPWLVCRKLPFVDNSTDMSGQDTLS